MKRVLLTMMVACLMATIAFAQSDYQDVVYLKNGSIIRGIIIEQVPNESLKIETADGNLFVYKIDEVEKMTKERPVASQRSQTPQEGQAGKPLNYDYVGGRKWYIGFGGEGNIVGDVPFGGAKFELGYYINPRNLLSVELGGGDYTDGTINYNYSAVVFLASWSYVVNLSNRLQWRIGPSLGLLSISGGFGFDPSGLYGEQGKPISEDAFVFGANTGITWNFSTKKRWFFDLGWRLSGNTGIHFDERIVTIGNDRVKIDQKDFSNMNQISISVGWRFGKAY